MKVSLSSRILLFYPPFRSRSVDVRTVAQLEEAASKTLATGAGSNPVSPTIKEYNMAGTWAPTKGDVMLTRNAGGEDKNESPGFWNHAAILIDDKQLVHALSERDSVVIEPVTKLIGEVEYAVVLRLKDTKHRNMFVRKAYSIVGSSYRAVASIFRYLRSAGKGENCVSVVRKAFRDSHGYDPGWQKPDDIFDDMRRFKMVGKKNAIISRNNGRRTAKEPWRQSSNSNRNRNSGRGRR